MSQSYKSVVTAAGPMPIVGYGTWPLSIDEAREGVSMALDVGYRHIDTAQGYGNERGVGQAIADSDVARDDIFLVTKVAPENFHPDDFMGTVEQSLSDLQTDAVDLLLLHWPGFDRPMEETLDFLFEAKSRGHAKAVGVSNYTIEMMKQGLAKGPIATNQVEFHVELDQERVRQAAEDLGIQLTAYCPLARGHVLGNGELETIARETGKSSAQVALRWIVQKGVSAICMTQKRPNAEANFGALDFTLSDDQMARLDGESRKHNRIVSPASMADKWDDPKG